MAIHVKSFKIQSYRGIQNLALENLNSINVHIDTFVMGNDWEGKFDFLKEYCEVVYLERTPEISTTKIKNDLK